MNGGNLPPRPSGRPDRGMINSRPESLVPPVYRQPEEPPKIVEEPKPVHHVAAPHHAKPDKKKRRFILPLVVAVVVIILGVAGYVALTDPKTTDTGINTSEFQAVFFTNGQVYFGKLQAFGTGTLKLTDIFYLQAQSATSSTNPQSTSVDSSNVQLIKLGNEVHGPEDAMIIEKSQVLFYENLKPDGKVSQSIAAYQKSH